MADTLHYNMTGSGRPLLLVHGWAMHRGVWQSLTSALAGCCTVIAVDLRGHGAAAALPGPYDFAAFADDLRLLAAQLSLDRVIALGWSMGVSVLLRLLQDPAAWIDALILVGGTPCFVAREDWPPGMPRAAVQRLQRRIERQYPEALASFHELLLTERERAALAHTPDYDLLTHPRHAPNREAACRSLRDLADADLRPALGSITVPTLLIHGDKDRLCMPPAADYMHRCISGSRVLHLPETGHVPFMTRPEAVAAAIRDFVRSLP